MLKTNARQEIIFLTPSLNGSDGISTLCRQSISACKQVFPADRIRVWSLIDSSATRHADLEADVDYLFAEQNRLLYAWQALKKARRGRHVHLVLFHVGLAPIALPCMLMGAEVSVILLGIEVWRPLSRLQAAALRRAKRILSISAYTAQEFAKENPQLADKVIDVCHLGMAETESVPKNAPEQPFALIVARMSSEERYKGHDQLLEAWSSVLDAVPDARLVIAGDGDDRPRLQAKAKALQLDSHVDFLGRVPDAKLAELYQACSFFVMPSPREGFGLVFLEAMRAGKACIGAPGAAEEVIQDGETGFIVDPNQPTRLLSSLVTLFQDPTLRIQMGLTGLNRYQQHFTATHFEDRFTSLLGLRPQAA